MEAETSTARVLGAALLATALAACGSGYPGAGGEGARKAGPPEPRAVRTARVAETPVGRTVVVTGTVAAHDQATLTTKVPGRVASMAVDLGSRVRRGQLLARIDPTDYAIRVQQAQAAMDEARARLGLDEAGQRVDPQRTGTVRAARAQLEEAKAGHDRAEQLAREGLISKAELDAAQAAHRVAESRYQDAVDEIQGRSASAGQRRAELALARQQLGDTAIYAPFDGVVQERRTSPGEYLPAGAPVVDLVKVDPLRFRAEVPEREAGSLRVGQEVRISWEGQAAATTKLARLSPTISERNRVLAVEADVPNPGLLRPGALVQAEIVTDASSLALTVPTEAVVSFAGIQKVLLVKDGKASERPIVVGRRNDQWTEVVSGVKAGDQVVLRPGSLQSGQPVTVTTADNR